MPNKRHTLFIFTISHYCEKTRWALDTLGIDYQLKTLAPGSHIKFAKENQLKRGSLPILITSDNQVIQGSKHIIDWAEQQSVNKTSLSETSSQHHAAEKRLDDILGVHVRRFFYSEALIEQSASVKKIFMAELSLIERCKLSLAWPLIQKMMIQAMDLGYSQGLESLKIIEGELDWLDSLIQSNKKFLIEDQFSRVDITAASLLGPLIKPNNHPLKDLIVMPPRLVQQTQQWQERPFWNWVDTLYATHRDPNYE